MAQTYYITARRMDHTVHGGHHVGSVRLLDGSVITRQDVLARLRQGYVFDTYNPSTKHQARVIPFQCSRCGTTYLTTQADGLKDDNLDNLPLF